MITVTYSTIDHFRKVRKFKTLKGARKFALNWVGPQDVEGGWYAVSSDGVGRVTWQGCSRAQLFGDGPPDGEFKIYVVQPYGDKYHTTREAAEADLKAMREYDPGTDWGIEERTVTKDDFSPSPITKP